MKQLKSRMRQILSEIIQKRCLLNFAHLRLHILKCSHVLGQRIKRNGAAATTPFLLWDFQFIIKLFLSGYSHTTLPVIALNYIIRSTG